MRLCRARSRPRVRGPQETFHTPSSRSSSPTSSPAQQVETLPHWRCHRRPPWALTSRPAKRSWSSRGGRVAGHGRGEEASREAGVCRSSASGGRSTCNSWRQWSHVSCGAGRVFAGGRGVSALSVRCLRSWRPFGGGCPGSMTAGRMPSRTHHAERGASLTRVCVAHGTPWSGRRRWGKPKSVNRRTHTGLASCTRVAVSAWPPRRQRLQPSAPVSG
jgi:hypothetical protein